jgi:hypothetical protein
MLTKNIAIINPTQLELLIQNKMINDFYGVAINLNWPDEKLNKAVQNLLFTSSIRFCITFSFLAGNSKPDKETLTKMYNNSMLYFFSENYIKVQNNPLISFISNSKSETTFSSLIIPVAKECFSLQGFKNISCATFNSDKENNFSAIEQPYYYCSLNSELSKADKSIIQHNYYNGFLNNKFVFINATNIQDFKSKYTEVKNIEASIKNENLLLYSSLLSIKDLKNKAEEHEMHIKLLEQRLENSNIFMALLRKDLGVHVTLLNNQHEKNILDRKNIVEERQSILDWYMQEYEILPLWYKRFGHVIKAVKGKRSVKSLFQQNKK